MAMSDTPKEWYYAGDGDEPVGPLSLEEVLHVWIRGRIGPATVCTRHDMKGWRKICETEPFAKFWQRIAQNELVSYLCKCGNRIIMSAGHSNSLARCKKCDAVFLVPDPPGRDEELAEPPAPSEKTRQG
jgi:hypothetical protein